MTVRTYSGRVEIVGLYRRLNDGAKYSAIRIGDEEIQDLRVNEPLNRHLTAALFQGTHVDAYVFKYPAATRVLAGLRQGQRVVTVDPYSMTGTLVLTLMGVVLLPVLIGALLLYGAVRRAHFNKTLRIITQDCRRT